MSVITSPDLAYTYMGASMVNEIPRIVTNEISAYKDSNLQPTNLRLGATGDLVFESVNDTRSYIGASNEYTWYTSSFSNDIRTDHEFLSVKNIGTTTYIEAPTNIKVYSASPLLYTAELGSLKVKEDVDTLMLLTDKNKFQFNKSAQVQGNVFCDKSIYGQNLNLWLDRDNKPYNRIGYALTINNNDQLEIIKYTKFDSKYVTKKIALFGHGPSMSNEVSDTSYVVYDTLQGMPMADGSNVVTSSYVSSGSNMVMYGQTILLGDLIPYMNAAVTIGSNGCYLQGIMTSNIIFPTDTIMVNGYPLLSDALNSSSRSNAASSFALSNTLRVAEWTSNNALRNGGVFQAALGAESNLAYSFASAPSTGIYAASNASLCFATSNTTRMTIDQQGYVGIAGASDSNYALTVQGASWILSNLDVGVISSNTVVGSEGGKIRLAGTYNDSSFDLCVMCTRLYGTPEKSELVIFKGNDGQDTIEDRIRLRSGTIAFDTFSNSTYNYGLSNIRMFITSLGNVGINTMTPTSLFQVAGIATVGSNSVTACNASTGGLLRFGDVTTGVPDENKNIITTRMTNAATDAGELLLYKGITSNNTIRLRAGAIALDTSQFPTTHTDSNIRLYITPTGLVGINTTTPASTLHVNGDIITSNIIMTGCLDVGTCNMSSNTNTEGGTIRLAGTFQDSGYDHCVICTRLYAATEKSELMIFKGNDGTEGNEDRVRLRAGNIAFDTYPYSTRDYATSNIRMFITSVGNVGVNTTTPTSLFQVAGIATVGSNSVTACNASTGGLLRFGDVTNGSNGVPNENKNIITTRMTNAATDAGELLLYKGITSNNTIRLRAGAIALDTSQFPTTHADSNIRLYITPSGLVGINTTTPASTLHVQGDVTCCNLNATSIQQGGSNLSSLYLSTSTSNQIIAASNAAFTKVSSQWVSSGSNIYYSNSSTSNECVGIGYSNPTYKLAVDGNIYASADVICYSDERLKTDLAVIPDALQKVKQIHGYTFARIDQSGQNRSSGVIAQQVMDVLPEVVYTDKNGMLSVAYGNMAGLFIQALHELDDKVEELKGKLAMFETTQ
jgi:hypothetical protein